MVCKQLRQEAAGKIACADHTKHADQQCGTAASRRAAFGLPTHQWHSRSHLVINYAETGMVFQHQLGNVCIVLTHNRLDEAVQRRLALCSHHTSSGALLLLLLLREQSRGQGRGQTGVNRGSGHDPAVVRAIQTRVRWGVGRGLVQSRVGQVVQGIPDQQHQAVLPEAAALQQCLAKQQQALLCR